MSVMCEMCNECDAALHTSHEMCNECHVEMCYECEEAMSRCAMSVRRCDCAESRDSTRVTPQVTLCGTESLV